MGIRDILDEHGHAGLEIRGGAGGLSSRMADRLATARNTLRGEFYDIRGGVRERLDDRLQATGRWWERSFPDGRDGPGWSQVSAFGEGFLNQVGSDLSLGLRERELDRIQAHMRERSSYGTGRLFGHKTATALGVLEMFMGAGGGALGGAEMVLCPAAGPAAPVAFAEGAAITTAGFAMGSHGALMVGSNLGRDWRDFATTMAENSRGGGSKLAGEAGEALGGGAEAGSSRGATTVTEEMIRDAMKDAPLKSQQAGGVSLPQVQAYVDKIAAGEVAPAIKVDGDIIVDGNHRYIAGRLMGQEPPIQPWAGGRPGSVVDWETIPIDPEPW